jgi:hypothetical protein
VGYCFGPMATTTTRIVRWNGTAWRQAASHNPAPNSLADRRGRHLRQQRLGGRADENGSILLRWKDTTWE